MEGLIHRDESNVTYILNLLVRLQACGCKNEEKSKEGKSIIELRPKIILIYQAELKDGKVVPSTTTEYLNSMQVIIPNKDVLKKFDDELNQMKDFISK